MKVIYTAIFDRYDNVPPIVAPAEGWTRILFTDSDLQVEGWRVVKLPFEPKIFRKVKIMPHLFLPKEHTVSIWHDGNLLMKILPQFAVDEAGFWLMKHPERNCAYKEADACIILRKDSREVIGEQMKRYREDGFPENISANGLPSTGVIVRANNPAYYKTAELWWDEVQNGSVRDQLSFPYAAWKTNLQYKVFPHLYGFEWTPHYGKNRYNQYNRA
jgi:hypothetical protein